MEAARPENFHSLIYLITCTHPDAKGKHYIGQVQSHVLNHGKYRPYGVSKRWGQHVSAALVNNSVNQCWKLNNAIRKYGPGAFDVEELGPCDPDVADLFETKFIRLFDSVNNGYNITT